MAFGKKNNQVSGTGGGNGPTVKPVEIDEPALSQYGHEGLRSAIARSAQPNASTGGRGGGVAGNIIQRLRKGQQVP